MFISCFVLGFGVWGFLYSCSEEEVGQAHVLLCLGLRGLGSWVFVFANYVLQ